MPDTNSFPERQKRRVKRLYTDLVRGRARVQVVEAQEPELSDPPIFIAGLFRSGTTLLRYILDSHSRIACPGETTFLSDLHRMSTDQRSLAGFEALGVDRDSLLRRQARFAASFYEDYARARRKPRWADKSPSYVEQLDYLAELYPNARFVLLTRHPLDQIHSHTRGGSSLPDRLATFGKPDEDCRILGARYWVRHTELLLSFASSQPERCHRISYEDLCHDPYLHVQNIVNFLEEPWEPEMVHYWDFDHDRGLEDDRVRTMRRYELSSGKYRRWPSGLQSEVIEIVVGAAERAGYMLEQISHPS